MSEILMKRKKKKDSRDTSNNEDLSNLIRLSKYIGAYKGAYLIIFLGLIISSGLSLLPPWLIRIAMDSTKTHTTTGHLWPIALVMVVASLLQGAIDYFTKMMAESKAQKIIYKIREEVYTHLSKQSFSYFDDTHVGELMSRITSDAEVLQKFYGFASLHIINNLMFIIGVMIIMFIWNIKLALLYIMFIPFMLFGIGRYAFKVRPAHGKNRKILGKLTKSIKEQLSGIQAIKIFGNEEFALENFNKMNDKNFDVNNYTGKVTSFWMPYVFVFIGLGTGIVIYFGGREIIKGSISIGVLVGFITYIGLMLRPVRQTGMLVSQVSRALAAAERIFEVLDSEPDVKDETDAIDVENVEGEVLYNQVNFSYSDSNLLLKDITFKVNQGETIAIIGPTGVGKTSLVHLLPRFYDVVSGEISIDGMDIKKFTVESLRKHIGIVMQQTYLFNMTIKDNIVFGSKDITMEDIREAAKLAQIDDYIMSLPNQYETMIGEQGINLSGGQKQRIGIARTLILNPKILILDEPTASVDANTDDKIQKAIATLCENRTVFIIAHRLWTLRHTDKILVINDGKVSQYDTHETLVNEQGIYRDLFTKQISSEQFDLQDIIGEEK